MYSTVCGLVLSTCLFIDQRLVRGLRYSKYFSPSLTVSDKWIYFKLNSIELKPNEITYQIVCKYMPCNTMLLRVEKNISNLSWNPQLRKKLAKRTPSILLKVLDFGSILLVKRDIFRFVKAQEKQPSHKWKKTCYFRRWWTLCEKCRKLRLRFTCQRTSANSIYCTFLRYSSFDFDSWNWYNRALRSLP